MQLSSIKIYRGFKLKLGHDFLNRYDDYSKVTCSCSRKGSRSRIRYQQMPGKNWCDQCPMIIESLF